MKPIAQNFAILKRNHTNKNYPHVQQLSNYKTSQKLTLWLSLFRVQTSRKAGGDWDEPSWISSQIGFYRQTQTNQAQSDSGQDIFHSGAMTVKLEKYYHKTKTIAQRQHHARMDE